MSSRVHRVHITAPVEVVFDAIADVASHHRWQAGLVRSECTVDARAAGATGTEIRRLFGREFRFPWEITAFEPSRRWGFRALGGPMRPQALLDFESDAHGTQVTSTLTVAGVLGWLAIGPLYRQQLKNYLALKKLLEGEVTNRSA